MRKVIVGCDTLLPAWQKRTVNRQFIRYVTELAGD